ncbi:hypothetical protein FSP39_021487 [Pinctada imbricata]|uniref:Kazal-like domain-containing protein n=1 Tax=Pinctada imbricata TaxID=66713 RepID=A0AA88YW86_PINIB|nr:hypothetical protein FSP39_021487 [Pinctada imbricata]
MLDKFHLEDGDDRTLKIIKVTEIRALVIGADEVKVQMIDLNLQSRKPTSWGIASNCDHGKTYTSKSIAEPFKIIFLVVPSQSLSVSFASLDSLCRQVASIDCSLTYLPDGDETLCGTDGNTYLNFCWYAQRRCKNNNLTMKHFGACLIISGDNNNNSSTSTKWSSSTTVASPTTTRDIIVQVFCAHTDDTVCPQTLDPVCATNYQFYRNE